MNARSHRCRFPRAFFLLCALLVAGCERDQTGDYPAANRADCLPAISLLDQDGHSVSLASLKGRPLIIDFIYASCQGPCPMLTAKLGSVAKLLGPRLGREVKLVSITLDPEHDHPAELKQYAEKQGVSEDGWLFLTGTPAQIEQVLAVFDLRRASEPDGSVTHNVASFLLGADGRQIRQYNGLTVRPDAVVSDIERALAGASR